MLLLQSGCSSCALMKFCEELCAVCLRAWIQPLCTSIATFNVQSLCLQDLKSTPSVHIQKKYFHAWDHGCSCPKARAKTPKPAFSICVISGELNRGAASFLERRIKEGDRV